jgi:nucleoside-diphosphate-sugar epimerase
MTGSGAGSRLLVTGVAGFIGRHVAEEAVRRGYRVTGADRNHCRVKGMEFVRVDIRDRDRVRQITQDHEYLVHLAAVTANVEFSKNPAACYDINANGFANIVDAAARSGCKRLVYASSAAVYIDCFSEDAVIDPAIQRNHYAKSKMINEMVAQSYEEIYGMRTIGLRYFNVYGDGENEKGDYASIITLFLRARAKREPLVVYGDGTQARDLINVRDAVQITMDLLEKGSTRVYNVGTGVPTPYLRIAEMIDKDNIAFVTNPLSSYQHYTRADTGRLREAIGEDYEFIDLDKGVRSLGG